MYIKVIRYCMGNNMSMLVAIESLNIGQLLVLFTILTRKCHKQESRYDYYTKWVKVDDTVLIETLVIKNSPYFFINLIITSLN